MIDKKISIIGAGHMGQALAAGFLRGKIIKRNNLLLSNKTKNISAAEWGKILIIAVKPSTVSVVAREVRNYLKRNVIIISTAACVSFNLLEKYFGANTKIVRIMPNLPVAFGMGVVGWMGNKNITKKDKNLIIKLLSNLGCLVKCENENILDKLTVISGCGPGYFAYIISALERSVQEFGFTKQEARKIILQLIDGVIAQLKSTGLSSDKLAEFVATKGGITEAIINDLEKNNFYQLLFNSMKKGYDKIGRIRKELEDDNL